MSKLLVLGSNDPLHRLHVHYPPLKIRNRHATSIEQARCYIAMCQDRSITLAEDLLQHPVMCEHPTEIIPWLRRERYSMSAALVFSAGSIYEDLLMYLVAQGNNAIASAINHIIRYLDVAELRVVSAGQKDYVFGSGVRVSATWDSDADNLPGFDEYGLALTKVIKRVAAGTIAPVFGVDQLLTRFIPFGYSARRTVLVLSDSFFRQVVELESGTVVPKGGACFGDLVRACDRDPDIDFQKYQYVIIQAGINDAQRSKATRRHSWKRMERYLVDNIVAGFPCDRILVSLPIPHPSVEGTRDYSRWIMSRLDTIHVRYVDWETVDENPFITEGGHLNVRLRDWYDQFHLSHAGIRELWRIWCAVFPPLRLVRVDVSPINYAQRDVEDSTDSAWNVP